MPNRSRTAGRSDLCYLILRAHKQQQLFFEPADYGRFLGLVRHAIERERCVVYGFCLLEAEAHLAVQMCGSPVDRFVLGISPAYARTLHERRGITGPVFERYELDRLRAEQLLPILVRTIHRTPVNRGLCTHPGEWRWSSYNAYTGQEPMPWVMTSYRNGPRDERPQLDLRQQVLQQETRVAAPRPMKPASTENPMAAEKPAAAPPPTNPFVLMLKTRM